ncbi:MAG: PPC domain-containing protein, partial [Byssovorax sp.]
VSAAIAGQCGDPTTELACGTSYPGAQGGQLAKVRGRMLGSATQATALPIYLATGQSSAITLDVQILPPEPQPVNETCGTAEPVTIGTPFAAPVLDAVKDLASACTTTLGELVYSFTLAAASDVDVYASSADGDGLPSISLRGSGCALDADEIACQTGKSPHVFRHSLAAGTYYVAVSASAPTVVNVTVEASSARSTRPTRSISRSPPTCSWSSASRPATPGRSSSRRPRARRRRISSPAGPAASRRCARRSATSRPAATAW